VKTRIQKIINSPSLHRKPLSKILSFSVPCIFPS
jgi:hypothetical protein